MRIGRPGWVNAKFLAWTVRTGPETIVDLVVLAFIMQTVLRVRVSFRGCARLVVSVGIPHPHVPSDCVCGGGVRYELVGGFGAELMVPQG